MANGKLIEVAGVTEGWEQIKWGRCMVNANDHKVFDKFLINTSINSAAVAATVNGQPTTAEVN